MLEVLHGEIANAKFKVQKNKQIALAQGNCS